MIFKKTAEMEFLFCISKPRIDLDVHFFKQNSIRIPKD